MDAERAWVVHGAAGWDEPTPSVPSSHSRCGGGIRRLEVDPRDFGLAPCAPGDLAGGEAAVNLAALREVFEAASAAPIARRCCCRAGWPCISPAAPRPSRRASQRPPRDWMAAAPAMAAAAGGIRRGDAPMSGFLDEMARSSEARVVAAKRRESYADLAARAARAPAAARLRLSPGFDVIAELKLRSPAAGQLGDRSQDRRAGSPTMPGRRGRRLRAHRTDQVRRVAGRSAGGRRRARASGRAAMRKDFLVDPYQVLEARAAGAGGVLVILRMLRPAQNRAIAGYRRPAGPVRLAGTFDAADLAVAQTLLAARSPARTSSSDQLPRSADPAGGAGSICRFGAAAPSGSGLRRRERCDRPGRCLRHAPARLPGRPDRHRVDGQRGSRALLQKILGEARTVQP